MRHFIIIKLQPDVIKLIYCGWLIEEEGSLVRVGEIEGIGGIGGITGGLGFAAEILSEVKLDLTKLAG